MNEDIHYLRGGDEACCCGKEIVGRKRTGLDSQGAERKEGFFCKCRMRKLMREIDERQSEKEQ